MATTASCGPATSTSSGARIPWSAAYWRVSPCVWQIYPQDDQAHHAKLVAFLDWLQPAAGPA
jgi:hypothetical protein